MVDFNLEEALRVAAKLSPPESPKDSGGIKQLSDWMVEGDCNSRYPTPTAHDIINGLQKLSLVCRLGRVVVTRDSDPIRTCSISDVLSGSYPNVEAKIDIKTVRMNTICISERMSPDIILDDPQVAARMMVDAVMRTVSRIVDDAAFLGNGEDGVPLGILRQHEEKKKERGGHDVTREAIGTLISRLSPRYKQDAAFFVGPDVYYKLLMLKDTSGLSLATPHESGYEIYGFPVHVVQAMEKAIVFGSMKDGISVYVSPRIGAYRQKDWMIDMLNIRSYVDVAIVPIPEAFAVYYLYDNIIVRTIEEVKEKAKRRVRQVKDKLTIAVMELAVFIHDLPETLKALPGRLKDFLCRRRDKDDEEYEDEFEEDA